MFRGINGNRTRTSRGKIKATENYGAEITKKIRRIEETAVDIGSTVEIKTIGTGKIR